MKPNQSQLPPMCSPKHIINTFTAKSEPNVRRLFSKINSAVSHNLDVTKALILGPPSKYFDNTILYSFPTCN